MREQVVAQKVGNRSGMGGKGKASGAQKPVRRDRGESGLSIAARLRSVATYVPSFLKIGLALVVTVLVFLGYRAAASASFFQVKSIEVAGVSRVSNDAVIAAVRRDVATTGVWRADLNALNEHLEKLPWVKTAVVTRVLPNGIRVRITEREPRVVVRTAEGKFVWVDEDGVVLSEMLPSDQMPNFFLRGWNEDATAAAKTENIERVKKFLELQHDWDGLGLSERVSEVNLIDTRDVRAQLAGDDSQIEIRLGSQELASRLKKALEVLDSQRQTSRGPLISYIDLTQGKRAIVGLVSGAHVSETQEPGSGEQVGEEEFLNNDAGRTVTTKTAKDTKSKTPIKKTEQKRT
ncbi:MAG TPA: FtsQ-type POTRA domain-containing protein [Pyrinomonadaceae bacterium]